MHLSKNVLDFHHQFVYFLPHFADSSLFPLLLGDGQGEVKLFLFIHTLIIIFSVRQMADSN